MSPIDEEDGSAALDETIAYVALRRLQSRYADIVTRRAWPEFHEIMRPDCVVTVDLIDRAIDFNGPQAIGDFIGGQLEQFDFFEFVILNTVMEIDAAAGTAGARMYMQEARQNVADGQRSDTFGVYHDRFVRDADGRWWFARRHYRSYARTRTGPDDGSPRRDLDVFPLATRPLHASE
ncbi:MAG: nuclear transport factor 2 family protein [Acidimicrobiales bacterium]